MKDLRVQRQQQQSLAFVLQGQSNFLLHKKIKLTCGKHKDFLRGILINRLLKNATAFLSTLSPLTKAFYDLHNMYAVVNEVVNYAFVFTLFMNTCECI